MKTYTWYGIWDTFFSKLSTEGQFWTRGLVSSKLVPKELKGTCISVVVPKIKVNDHPLVFDKHTVKSSCEYVIKFSEFLLDNKNCASSVCISTHVFWWACFSRRIQNNSGWFLVILRSTLRRPLQHFGKEIFLWRIVTGMDVIISDLSDWKLWQCLSNPKSCTSFSLNCKTLSSSGLVIRSNSKKARTQFSFFGLGLNLLFLEPMFKPHCSIYSSIYCIKLLLKLFTYIVMRHN